MKIFLIDGNSFCYRAFYAIPHLTNSKGRPTNAVYGFITMLNKLKKDENPDGLGIAFDLKGPTFRHKRFEEYKAHRKPMPDELKEQMPVIKDVLRAYKIPILEMEGYEADDILATAAKSLADKGSEVYIVTGDKDALQIVGDQIKVYSTHKDGLVYDERGVKERYGVEPLRIPDLIGLMGDSSDNIPGVTGFGEKTAKDLLGQFGGLEEIYKRLDEVKGEAKRQLLVKYEEQARMSKELAMLDYEVPFKVAIAELKLKEPDSGKLLEIFRELEFKSLVKELTPKDALKSKYTLIDTKDEFDDLCGELKKQRSIVLDFETTSAEPMSAEPIGISFSFKKGEAYYAAFKSEEGAVPDGTGRRGIDPGYALKALKPIFEDVRIGKTGHNVKYEYVILKNNGIGLNRIDFDTMIASYLLDPSKFNHSLDDVSLEYLGHKMIPLSDLIGSGKDRRRLDEVPPEKVAEYSCEDSDVTFRLKELLSNRLEEKGLDKLFYGVEMPLVTVLGDMERTGVAIDTGFLKDMSDEMEKDLDGLRKEIYRMAEGEFNVNSPKQLSVVLFEKLKLPVIKRTKTGISTDEDVLNKLAPSHPIVESLLRYRELSKLRSTYVDALPAMVNPKTRRLHTSFNQTVTATGRLSSSNPNLQNIPVKTKTGREIRRAFIPSRRGDLILSADYSQIELRLLAHLSGDHALTEAFMRGSDIHAFTAALVFGVDEKDVTKEMRAAAKTVNFGIIYGMSPYGLARDLKIGIGEADEFIKSYFKRYPGVKEYMDGRIEEARKTGYVTTILKRRRYIPEINSENMSVRQFAERTAINTPIQGSAADLIKAAMINVASALKRGNYKSVMILQVHDELVFEVARDELAEVKGLVRREMENVFKLDVPVEVTAGAGKNWLEAGK